MKSIFTDAIVIAIVVTGGSLVITWPFMWMWNYSVSPIVDGVHDLDYWRAFCLLWFLGLFFTGLTSRAKS